jgi:hypothetical protein
MYTIKRYRILHESLRWLLANGKYEEAKKWIKRAAKWNKTDAKDALSTITSVNGEVEVLVEKEIDANGPQSDKKAAKIIHATNGLQPDEKKAGKLTRNEHGSEKLSVLDFFRHRQILLTSIIVWVIW